MASCRHVRAATNGFKTNDVIEDWRLWLRSVARSPLLTVPRILFIASWEWPLFCIFQWLSTMQRKYQLMHLYSVRKFSFCKVYTAFVGNLFYRLLHKYIPCAVCWKASKTSTLIRNRRTLGEPFVDFAQLTASLHMKTANIKKVILTLSSTVTCCVISHFLIFAVLMCNDAVN